MSALILDAGALVAVDRGDRAMMARLRVAQQHGAPLRSNAMVIAQVWRDRQGRQAVLARLLRAVDVRAVSPRTAGKPVSCWTWLAPATRLTQLSYCWPARATGS